MFLHYWRKLPGDFDDLTSAQLRQLADQTDRLIDRDRLAAAKAKAGADHGGQDGHY